MAHFKSTPLDDIPKIRDTLKDTFRTGLLRPLNWRRNQLYQLARLVQDNKDALTEAVHIDLGKPKTEIMFAEVAPIISRALKSAEKLDEWTKAEIVDVPDFQKPWSPRAFKTPKGVVLIIGPWNYPLILTLQPLIGAIAAGCTAVVKPSEFVPNYSQLLADLLPKYLDKSAFCVVNGGIQEASRLLELQWDHIVYTGNSRVARIIAAAAAKHLTPTTLELGGKSPVIVDPNTDINLAAKRILWGKTQNAGQICVAPDYVLIPEDKQSEFIRALQEHQAAFFPESALNSSSYGRIVTSAHQDRLKSMLDRTKGDIVFGGKTDNKNGFEPTVVSNVKEGDSLLEEEIFGPILPIVAVANISEAIDFVNARPHPLVLYTFTEDANVKDQVLNNTISGNLVFNDTFQQMDVAELPFGGVGESGIGHQQLKYSFDCFTHTRGSVDVPKEAEQFLNIRYPPYASNAVEVMAAAAFLEIPKPI